MDDFSSNPRHSPPTTHGPQRRTPDQSGPPILSGPLSRRYSVEFLACISRYLDGAIFPYTIDFDRPDGVDAALTRILGRLDPFDLDLILMVYATKMSVAEYSPSASYVAALYERGSEFMKRGRSSASPPTPWPRSSSRSNAASPTISSAMHPPRPRPSPRLCRSRPDSPGRSVGHSLPASLLRAGLLSRRDCRLPLQQLLVDGQVIWDQDVASDAALAWVGADV